MAAGCATAPPKGHFDETAERMCTKKVCYRVGELPASWQVVHVEGASIGFFDRNLDAVIESNASCHDDAEAAPLATLTRHLLIGYTERNIRSQDLIQLDQREALRTRVDAKLDGVLMSLDLVVMKRNGCIFDVTYAAPPRTFDRGAPDFSHFLDGFADDRAQRGVVVPRGS